MATVAMVMLVLLVATPALAQQEVPVAMVDW